MNSGAKARSSDGLSTSVRGSSNCISIARRVVVCPLLLLIYLGTSAPSFGADQENQGAQQDQGSQQQPQKTEQLEEVVVTGTHIRGVSPASPLIVITSADIENSGLSTAGEVLRDLPESFAGGQQSTIGVNGSGPFQNSSNSNYSDSANLRGFGSDSTLVLINGRRVPQTGFQGSADISGVPLAAIDRIEVVTDGASALYGSDAVGGVVNFILKRDFTGAETRAELSGTTEGGGFQQRYSQLLGASWRTGSVMLSYQYRDQEGVYGDQRSWYVGPQPMSLIPSIHQNSVYLNADQYLTDDLETFVQAIYDHTSSFGVGTYGGNTPTYNISVHGYTYSATLGGTLALPHQWQLTATGTYGVDRFDELDIDPCCNYSSDLVPTNRLGIAELSGEGPIVTLPSGDLRAAVGAGYRSESIVYKGFDAAEGSRNIHYAYGELTVPVVGKDTRHPGLQELLITLAGRYEHYSDTGGHFSPLVGLSYKPVSDVRLRGTWNKSFHAPNLFAKYLPYYVLVNYPVDAAPPASGTVNAVIPVGGNVALRPETARTYTLGFDWKPQAHPQLLLSGTYFNIAYDNRIIEPVTDATSVLADPVFAPIVTLNPSASQQEALLGGASFVANITGMPFDPSSTAAIIDDRLLNVSHQTARGFDLRASFTQQTTIGSFSPSLNASFLQLRQKLLSESPEKTISGLVFYPPKYKIQAVLTWTQGAFGATGILNYVPGAENNLVTPSTHVGSWSTLDLQGSYTLSAYGHWLDGLSARLSVLNALDRQPPYVQGTLLGYDNTQASPLGRVVKGELAKKW